MISRLLLFITIALFGFEEGAGRNLNHPQASGYGRKHAVSFLSINRGGASSTEAEEEILQSDEDTSPVLSDQKETGNESENSETVDDKVDSGLNDVDIIVVPKPAGIDQDPDGIPTRFLLMYKGDRKLAAEAYESTLQWRKENDIDDLLNKPHPRFDICKMLVPHYMPGYDAKGNIILVQRPGLLNMDLKRANEVTDEEMVLHMVYVLEYCWSICAPPKENADSTTTDCVMTSIIDMTGINLGVIRHRERIEFASKFVKIMSAHYPSRSYKTLIINAPGWFGALFKCFKPMLRESTRKKIEIHSGGKGQDKALKKILGDSTPEELLSKSDLVLGDEHSSHVPGPHSDIELNLRSFCVKRLEAHNMTMESIAVASI